MSFFRLCLIFLSTSFFFNFATFGQVDLITNLSTFSESAVDFDFGEFMPGTAADSSFSQWGLEFSGTGGSAPVIEQSVFAGVPNTLLTNQGGDQMGTPLTIDFRFPVSRVLFTPFNRSEDTVVTLTAFDAQGDQLGEVQGAGGEELLGVETAAPEGISKLVINYSDTAEQIDGLVIDFLERPEFTRYLAQIGDGPIPGTGSFQTVIVATNLSSSTAEGAIRLFDSDGQPVALSTDQGVGSEFELQIPAFSSITIETDGSTDPATAGYAQLQFNVPIEGTAIFRVLDQDGNTISEAGVGSDEGRAVQVGSVIRLIAADINSGIALVNVGDRQAQTEIRLFGVTGTFVDVNNDAGDLPPGGHIALFLDALFPNAGPGSFTGSVFISSDVPLAAVILRTSAGGLVSASLPTGSMED